jgi:isopenicillin-N N-acyltransferase-like protein
MLSIVFNFGQHYRNSLFMGQRRSFRKTAFKLTGIFLALASVCTVWFLIRIALPTPNVADNTGSYTREEVAPNYFRVGNNWLRKNSFGIWEMYLEGTPYERGLIYGTLASELVNEQEQVFVDQIRNMVPGQWILKGLKYFVGWFNRDIDHYVQEENLLEIYGISKSFSHEFDFIGDPYYRVLNYHAAHDIGHALTDFNMVGCTSFAANKEYSADSSLIIGRNFDFNMGDRFAENKLILFMKPDSGYAFASVTWAGFTGVVSGINEKGLSVTLNAAKSDLPTKAKTPISLLAREILQYAGTIAEAVAIAGQRETFVSESLMIGSAQDDRAVIIEKTPSKMDVFDSGKSLTICSNHYQSSSLANEPANLENLENSDSQYRFTRMKELISQHSPIGLSDGVAMLRNIKGAGDQFIGYGNPKSINQLLAHHGIIFKPTEKKFWVSANPYQIGAFVGYDLSKVFSPEPFETDTELALPADPFLNSDDYRSFEKFKSIKNKITAHLLAGHALSISDEEAEKFIQYNPQSYLPYLLLGDYYKGKKKCQRAASYYQKCLTKELSSKKEVEQVKQKLKDCS